MPGDPAQSAKELSAEATCWTHFKTERNKARQRAAWALLQQESRGRLAARAQESLDNETGLDRAFKRVFPSKANSSRSVSSRLGPVNQTNSKSVSASGTASPAPLTTPKKPKR
eukprot:3502385-Rhodomonas_salina.1